MFKDILDKFKTFIGILWDKIKSFIHNDWKLIAFGICIILAYQLIVITLSVFRPVNPPVPMNRGPRVNYASDINFLDCLREQHTCIFANVRESNSQFIIENCGDENACIDTVGRRFK